MSDPFEQRLTDGLKLTVDFIMEKQPALTREEAIKLLEQRTADEIARLRLLMEFK